MSHPFLPEIIPEIPEHVVPTAPDPMEERLGVIYCVRCGRAMRTVGGREMSGASKPCVIVGLSLRDGGDA